jgi:hypothetical protein
MNIANNTAIERSMSAMIFFEYVREINWYPNIFVDYRMLFKIPVTMTSVERSFLKLKLLKNYLRSTMCQERLNVLPTLCIEKKLLEDINIEATIDDFSLRNVKRYFKVINNILEIMTLLLFTAQFFYDTLNYFD